MLPLFLALCALASDDASVWLARLSSQSARERDQAQRWLAVNLAPADYPALVRASRAGDAELARRLTEALAADDRHLGLAVLLLSEEEPALGRLGADAFVELVARWCPGAAGPLAPRARVVALLAEESDAVFELAAGEEAAGPALERLSRLSDLSVPLVIDPGLAGRAPRAHPALVHTAPEILSDLTRHQRVALWGVGEWDGERPGAGAWLVVLPRGTEREGGPSRLARWCVAVERGGEGAGLAARALAASGWPAAMSWLAQRWDARDDPVALDGLLFAAERGRVAPALAPVASRRRLLALADAGLAAGGEAGARRAERIARALARAGGSAAGGEDLAPFFFEGWDELDARRRWLRLVALEGRGRLDAPQVARVAAAFGGSGPPALRFQALRVLAGLTPAVAPPAPGDLGTLEAWARARGLDEVLLDLLAALRLAPEALAGAPETIVLDALARAAPAAAASRLWIAVEAERMRDPAARRWLSWLERRVRRDGAAATAALLEPALEDEAGAGEGSKPRPLERLALLAGCLSPSRQVALFERLASAGRPGPDELELLGALGAGPRGASARRVLLAELGREPVAAPEILAAAFERAARDLMRALEDRAQAELAGEVWKAVAAPGHPLRERLGPRAWPPPLLPRATRLSELERTLADFQD